MNRKDQDTAQTTPFCTFGRSVFVYRYDRSDAVHEPGWQWNRGHPGAWRLASLEAGYEASFGTYEIDERTNPLLSTSRALVRSLIGKDLPRAFQFSRRELIVKSTRPDEHWRVAWEHN